MFGLEALHADEPDWAERVPTWLWAVAAVAGASAVAYGVLRLIRGERERDATSELDLLEDAAVERLRRDPVTGRSPIDVSALAPGILELTGVVPTHEAGQRAARLLHALPGVHTVINRLDTGSLEEQLATNRVRRRQTNGAQHADSAADADEAAASGADAAPTAMPAHE